MLVESDVFSSFAEPKYKYGCNCAAETEEAFVGHMIHRYQLFGWDELSLYANIPPEAFYIPSAHRIWAGILSAGRSLNVASLLDSLSAEDQIYLHRAIDRNVSGHPQAWAKKIMDLYTQRRMDKVSRMAQALSATDDPNPALTLQKIIAEYQAIATLSTKEETLFSAKEACEESADELLDAAEGKVLDTFPLGWADLDQPVVLKRGDLAVICARPSMGKTTFALNAACNLAQVGRTTLYLSLEMRAKELGKKILARYARIKGGEFQHPEKMSHSSVAKAVETTAKIEIPMWIDHCGLRGIADVEIAIMRAANRNNGQLPDVVFLDHLALLGLGDGKSSSTFAIEAFTAALKQLAVGLNIVIVLLSQLSRANETQQDKRPTLATLRNSGSIEQDANVVLGLYREAYYNKDVDPRVAETTEVIVMKNRDGERGITVNLVFDAPYSEFKSRITKQYS